MSKLDDWDEESKKSLNTLNENHNSNHNVKLFKKNKTLKNNISNLDESAIKKK